MCHPPWAPALPLHLRGTAKGNAELPRSSAVQVVQSKVRCAHPTNATALHPAIAHTAAATTRKCGSGPEPTTMLNNN